MRKRSAVITSVVLSGLLAGTAGSAQAAGEAPALGARPVFLVGTGAVVDASTAAPVAARAGGAVLYADVDGLPAASADFLKKYEPSSVVIVGGERAVGAPVQTALAASYPVHRFGGADRQETAALLAGLAASLPGPKGDKGDKGDAGWGGGTGATGPAGPAGPGVPNGGSTGQVLKKASGANQDTAWATAASALSIGTFAGSTSSGQSFANGVGQVPVQLTAALTNSTVPSPPTISGTEVSITQSGFYELTGSIRLATRPSGERYLSVQVHDGTSWSAVAEATNDFGGIVVLNTSGTVYLAQGNRVRLMLLNDTVGPVAALTDNPPRLSVVQLPTTQPS